MANCWHFADNPNNEFKIQNFWMNFEKLMAAVVLRNAKKSMTDQHDFKVLYKLEICFGIKKNDANFITNGPLGVSLENEDIPEYDGLR